MNLVYTVVLLLASVPCLAQIQPDSVSIRTFSRPGVREDTTDFTQRKNQLSSVQPIFSVSPAYGNAFLGFHFDFGTIFQERIKSSYPGFLGFGFQGGVKFRSGLMTELGISYQRFNQNAGYDLYNQVVVTDGDTLTTNHSVENAAMNVNQFLISVVYSDYRSPVVPLRYVYGGLAAGVSYFEERGTYRETISGRPSGIQILQHQSLRTYYRWNPTVVLILGMNFLYLPESHNWFSFDVRMDWIPNLHQKKSEPLRLYKSKDMNSIRATVRFLFDYSSDFKLEE